MGRCIRFLGLGLCLAMVLGTLLCLPRAHPYTQVRPLAQDPVKDKVQVNWYLVRDGVALKVYNVSLEKKGLLKEKDIDLTLDSFIRETSFPANQVQDLRLWLGLNNTWQEEIIDTESHTWTNDLVLDAGTPEQTYTWDFDNKPDGDGYLSVDYTASPTSDKRIVRVEVNNKFVGYLYGNDTFGGFSLDKQDVKEKTDITFTSQDTSEVYVIDQAHFGFEWGTHFVERWEWQWLEITPEIIEANPSQVLHRYGEIKLKHQDYKDKEGLIWFRVAFSCPVQRRSNWAWGSWGRVGLYINGSEFHPWWNNNWQYRKKLTFDNSGQSEDLDNFPVLVYLTDSNIDWTHVNNSGQDIRFVDSDDTTELDYEIEEWDDTNEAWIWVSVPRVNGSSATDFVYMYYGNDAAADAQNATGVWDSNFMMVQHLQETSGTLFDSTSNDNDGTGEGGVTLGAAGYVSEAIDCDGSDDDVTVADSASLSVTGSLTLEAIITADDISSSEPIIVKDDATSINRGYYLILLSDGKIRLLCSQTNNGGTKQYRDTTSAISTGNWYYVAATFNVSDAVMAIYVNGSEWAGTTTGSISSIYDSAAALDLGYLLYNTVDYWWNGTIDEARVSDSVRSADWVAAQDLSMEDAFITFASEETGATTTTTTTTLFSTVDTTGLTTTTTTSYTTTGVTKGHTTSTTTGAIHTTTLSTDGTIATTTTTTGSPTYTEIIRYTVSVARTYSRSVTEWFISTVMAPDEVIRKDVENIQFGTETVFTSSVIGTGRQAGVDRGAFGLLAVVCLVGAGAVAVREYGGAKSKKRKRLDKDLRETVEGKVRKPKWKTKKPKKPKFKKRKIKKSKLEELLD